MSVIANVVQRGTTIYIYDSKANTIGFITTVDGKLLGYTSGNINVRRGTMVYSFNAKGNFTGSVPA